MNKCAVNHIKQTKTLGYADSYTKFEKIIDELMENKYFILKNEWNLSFIKLWDDHTKCNLTVAFFLRIYYN